MAEPRSVTHWFGLLRDGDSAAAQRLWERYYPQLVGLARARLQGAALLDEPEDVALSAFASFCHHAERGRFPQLADRDGLWRLLVTLTVRKAAHATRDQARVKRGGDATAEYQELDALVGEEPTPEFAAQVAEEYRQLLERLADADLCRIAVWKMEGFSTKEIATKMDRALRSIERKLKLIRQIWEREVPP